MRPLNFSPKAFIFTALMDFRKRHPDSPFMPLGLLAEQLRVHEEVLVPAIEQLAQEGQLELHPMWPHLRELFISRAFIAPQMEQV
ncbi:MAG: hypothetical protein E6R04_11570 [Spirochaetes bacterium]|nr:MAG: hypothetical protein E6R04_11570 [Spirochaetota bacterium]